MLYLLLTPTRSKQLSTVAILGFQFGLYLVVVPMNFLRSISLHHCFYKMWYSLYCARCFRKYFARDIPSSNLGGCAH